MFGPGDPATAKDLFSDEELAEMKKSARASEGSFAQDELDREIYDKCDDKETLKDVCEYLGEVVDRLDEINDSIRVMGRLNAIAQLNSTPISLMQAVDQIKHLEKLEKAPH